MDRLSESSAFDVSTHTFTVPEKQLKSPEDMLHWSTSQAYSNIVGFVLTLNEAVKNKKISDEYPVSEITRNVMGILETIEKWIDEIPPVDQPQRFGNKAFRTLFGRLKERGPDLVKRVLPPELEGAVPELCTYLVESVGNETRIDYGTGHELAFVAFLCCACKIGVLHEEDYPALVLKVFDRYLNLVRRLQMTYRMEPAGSQGVWSLDDFQFLPFLWGSAQLYDHARIKPKSFPEEDIYNSFYKDYLFLAAIKYINQVKTGPFAEHSNQLWGISGVASWHKVNSGLVKMYKAEVLGKFPVMQHFLFGSLLTLQPSPPRIFTSVSTESSESQTPMQCLTPKATPFATPSNSHNMLPSHNAAAAASLFQTHLGRQVATSKSDGTPSAEDSTSPDISSQGSI
ncbi:serine/threonine-protein phosphatase 2a activator [Plakobranchus ocellatus]|uniref:Serine/threonine-protein phosphatase 2A activator n=1 Tax=Plakobranchus ocellatus TaxID=259542 RepID=A0AAV4DZ48_9GAST|nr:serine/threonine-protein phosphatase 2a activator [Plakobranchus ocellatus]